MLVNFKHRFPPIGNPHTNFHSCHRFTIFVSFHHFWQKQAQGTGQVTWVENAKTATGLARARFMSCFVTVTVTVDVLVARVRVRPNYVPTEKTGLQVGLGKEEVLKLVVTRSYQY